jgi:hypothetical protein
MDSNQVRMEAKRGSEIKTIQEKMDWNQERIEAKIGAEIKSIQERMDDGQEERKAMLDPCLENKETNPEKLSP